MTRCNCVECEATRKIIVTMCVATVQTVRVATPQMTMEQIRGEVAKGLDPEWFEEVWNDVLHQLDAK